jgi:hypothetical protein
MEDLTYEIDVWYQEIFLTIDGLIWSPASKALIFGLVMILRQLHFHIYYLFVATYYKTKSLSDVNPYECLDLSNYPTDFDSFLIDRVIQMESL